MKKIMLLISLLCFFGASTPLLNATSATQNQPTQNQPTQNQKTKKQWKKSKPRKQRKQKNTRKQKNARKSSRKCREEKAKCYKQNPNNKTGAQQCIANWEAQNPGQCIGY